MGSFTFNLDSLKASVGPGTANFESNLYSKTKDEDLTYTGTDTTVWDRVNAERLRRGLPSLTALGYPRPPEDTPTPASTSSAAPTNPDGTAKTFVVKGPPGLTLEQARAIFDQQVKTGSLVGFKSGEILSAVTQAEAGLPSALAQLGQAKSGIIGALGAGIPGATGPIGSLSAIPSSLGSAAQTAASSITEVLAKTPVTSPISIADFSKQAAALAPIAGISSSQVTGVLAQAKNLVSQSPAALTNAKGLGSYGLDVNQLELAGHVKPGTAAAYSTSSLTSVLNSPSVWTGKGGITGVENLLSSPATQEKIQQDLMSQGLGALSQRGIPVSSLTAELQSGLALNSAKSVADTEAFVKKLPLPPAVQAQFNATTRDAAFAVALTDSKIPEAFKAIEIPIPAIDTVNRSTLNAAIGRIVGNDKVPFPNYGTPDASLYSKTKDEDLIYTGSDTIVWDRINAERLRRGLPGLAAIGYPRPPEENTTTTA